VEVWSAEDEAILREAVEKHTSSNLHQVCRPVRTKDASWSLKLLGFSSYFGGTPMAIAIAFLVHCHLSGE
jgi:hypothetical protein